MGVHVDYQPYGAESQFPAKYSLKWMRHAFGVDNHKFTSWMNRPESKWSIPSIIIHIGDISYARGYPIIWDEFMHSIQPLSRRVPYMVAIGNHEYDYKGFGMKWHPIDAGNDSGGECGVPYSALFHMPAVKAEFAPAVTGRLNTRNLWFSFVKGPVTYIMMSSEHEFSKGPQYDFMIDALRNVDRSVTPWVVFTGHRPMYTSVQSTKFRIVADNFRKYLEPLFVKYKVDVALWAHVHQCK